MGYIKKLKNNELVGGTDKHTIYPVTSTEAVFEEITDGNESSFKSQKTINKEQQDELDDHEERIQAAEAEDIKSITINGSTREFRVNDRNNVDLTIYTVDNDPDMPDIASNVEDLRNMVGTSTPVLETSHKTRIENLETTVGTGGTIDSRIATTRAELQEQIDTKQIQLHVGSGLTLDNNGNLSATLDPAMSKVVTAWPSQASAVKGLIYLKPTSTAGVYEQRVYNDSSYTTLDNVTLSISTDDALNTGSANPLKNSTVAAQIGYFDHTGNNDNDGSSKVKNITATGFTLPTTAGGAIKIKMKEPNTYAGTQADPVQLQFNNVTSTKKTLLYNHEIVSATNTWERDEVISVYYDGTYYQASNAQGGSNKKIDAYLLGDLRALAVGQVYEKEEAVKTTDKQFRRINKDISTLSLSEILATADIKVSGSKTYRAASAVSTYNPTPSTPYSAGAYALGIMTVYTLTVAAESVTAGNITVNGTEVAVEATDDAVAIASKIADALVIDGWTDSANDNVVTVRCNTIGNNTTTITIGVGDTGVVVEGVSTPSVAGTDVIMKYDGESWAVATPNGMATDGILVEVDEAWLIENATVQNSITKDLSIRTIVLDNKKGNFAWKVGNISPTTGQIVTFYDNRYVTFNKNSLGDNIHSFNIYTEGITGKNISLYYYNGSKYISFKILTAGDNIIDLPNYQQFLILVWDKPTASQTANCVLQVTIDKNVKEVIQEHDNRITQVENTLANTFTNPIIRASYPDPAIWYGEDGYWYAFSTGSLSSRTMYRSANLINWENTGEIPFTQAAVEAWTALGKNDFWAPEVVKVGDKWNMYLSSQTNPLYVFTSNHPTFGFELVGVIADRVLTAENIDACVRYDRDGTLWLFFDSYRQGMYRVKLNETGTQIISDTLEHVAGLPNDAEGNTNRAKTFEGAYLYRRKGYWYLIVSAGNYLNATYCLRVGRSTTLDGTFVDKEGNPMTEGNASLLLSSSGTFYGTGHNGPIITDKDNRTWMFFHSHWTGTSSSGRPMCISEVLWDEDGWPYFKNNTLTVSGIGPRM